VETCLRATGLDEAPFCAERQRHGGGWILIELHARLGEDPGLEQAMWDARARPRPHRGGSPPRAVTQRGLTRYR
jgi:hypothetical protein